MMCFKGNCRHLQVYRLTPTIPSYRKTMTHDIERKREMSQSAHFHFVLDRKFVLQGCC